MTVLRRWRPAAIAALIVVLSFAAGVWVQQTFPDRIPVLGPSSGADQRTAQQVSGLIQANYYDAPVDSTKLSQGSAKGIVQSLGDTNSQYLTPEQYRSQLDASAGRHQGAIGVSVAYEDGRPVVSGVLPNSPALRAGLQSDDVILEINGSDTHELTPAQTSAMIRGVAGSAVQLLVSRSGATMQVTVTRENFQSPSVESSVLRGDLLYLRVYQFGDSTQKEFDERLDAGLPGARGVVLDLRGNGGGRVDAAVAMVSRFVADGEVYEERGRGGHSERVSVDGNHPAAGVPLVVLVDRGSASASEIVAGALQAHRRATVVGTTTFGKGSVQATYGLADGGALRLTVQQWFLPGGRSISQTGLTPDVAVDLAQPTAMFDVVHPGQSYAADTQLQRALQILGG